MTVNFKRYAQVSPFPIANSCICAHRPRGAAPGTRRWCDLACAGAGAAGFTQTGRGGAPAEPRPACAARARPRRFAMGLQRPSAPSHHRHDHRPNGAGWAQLCGPGPGRIGVHIGVHAACARSARTEWACACGQPGLMVAYSHQDAVATTALCSAYTYAYAHKCTGIGASAYTNVRDIQCAYCQEGTVAGKAETQADCTSI